jgi:hypothetical protein
MVGQGAPTTVFEGISTPLPRKTTTRARLSGNITIRLHQHVYREANYAIW